MKQAVYVTLKSTGGTLTVSFLFMVKLLLHKLCFAIYLCTLTCNVCIYVESIN